MKKHFTLVNLILLVLASLCLAQGGQEKKKTGPSTSKPDPAHVMMAPDQVQWQSVPPSLPPGAQLAVLDGDPSAAGASYSLRLKMPDGYKVPPHWHPVDENVIVLKGTLLLGRGEKFDPAAGHALRVGGYARMPKDVRHFAWAKGETVIQVYGIGPFEINYVNPTDDPRQRASSK